MDKEEELLEVIHLLRMELAEATAEADALRSALESGDHVDGLTEMNQHLAVPLHIIEDDEL